MATDKKSLFVNGVAGVVAATPAEEETRARDLARRYRWDTAAQQVRASCARAASRSA